MTLRFAAAVEYFGANYAGWQRQQHAPSVQGCLEQALGQVANVPVETVCAGRTDAGVHAVGQIVHFDTTAKREPIDWLFGANALLPRDISLRWVQQVDQQFHARFSATSRRYCYFILDRRARSGLLDGRVAWSRHSLDVDIMHRAGQCLLGEHDFSAFRAAECQSRTPMRHVSELSVGRRGDLVCIEVAANAFLHHMVRNIAGVLMQVGSGQKPPEWPQAVLDSRDRTQGGITAPAAGLYLVRVNYPSQWELQQPGGNESFLLP